MKCVETDFFFFFNVIRVIIDYGYIKGKGKNKKKRKKIEKD